MKRNKQKNAAQSLVNQLHAVIRSKCMTLRDIADLLGISYIYMASLSSGARQLSALNIEKQRKLADFLGITMIDFYLQCGMLRDEDIQRHLSV